MNRFLRQLRSALREVALTPEEKTSLRATLETLTTNAPVRGVVHERPSWRRFFAFPFPLSMGRLLPVPILAMLTLALVAGASVAAAAEHAVPGDTLYPVKINVNEALRSAVTVTAEGKASWEARRVERRLEEIERIAEKTDVSATQAATMRATFDAQATRTQQRITELEAQGHAEEAAAVGARLEAVLTAHTTILETLETETGGTLRETLNGVRAAVHDAEQTTGRARLRAETSVVAREQSNVRAAAERRRTATVRHLAEVTAFLDRAQTRGTVRAEVLADARAQVSAAEALVADGEAKLAAGASGDAFVTFQEASIAAQRAKVLVAQNTALKQQRQRDDAEKKKGDEQKKEREREEEKREERRDDPRSDAPARPRRDIPTETTTELRARVEDVLPPINIRTEVEANDPVKIETTEEAPTTTNATNQPDAPPDTTTGASTIPNSTGMVEVHIETEAQTNTTIIPVEVPVRIPPSNPANGRVRGLLR